MPRPDVAEHLLPVCHQPCVLRLVLVLATGGIAHFKTGFGGREVRYIGAWDLVLDPVGRRAYELAQGGRVWWARRRRGIAGGPSAAAFGPGD